MRDLILETAETLGDAVGGRPRGREADILTRVADPYAAMARLGAVYRGLVAQEEKIDIDAETRATRMAAERKAREQAENAENANAAREPEAVRRAEQARSVKQAVRAAYRDAAPTRRSTERDAILTEAFTGFERFSDYGGDPAEIVADFFTELGLEIPDDEDDGDDDDDGSIDPADKARARALRMARQYLDQAARKSKPPDG